MLYVQKHIPISGWKKKSNSKLLETFEARRHVMAFANQTQRQDKLGTGKKKPKREDLTKTLKSHNFNPYLAHDNQYSLRNCRKAVSSFMSIQPSYFSQV